MALDQGNLPDITGPTRHWTRSLRQEFLDSLDAARAADLDYIGSRSGFISMGKPKPISDVCRAAGWKQTGQTAWLLSDGIYDMRQSLRFLAEKHGHIATNGSITKEFCV